jgi:penicillin V acylase-like amidase (Ntn superfamily)
MSADYPANQKIGDLELSPFGMGGGSRGLPGDFTPPSRFVRMAFYLQNDFTPEDITSKAQPLAAAQAE